MGCFTNTHKATTAFYILHELGHIQTDRTAVLSRKYSLVPTKWWHGVQLAPFPQKSPQQLLEKSLKGKEEHVCSWHGRHQTILQVNLTDNWGKALITACIMLVTEQLLTFLCVTTEHILAWGCLALHMMASFDGLYRYIHTRRHFCVQDVIFCRWFTGKKKKKKSTMVSWANSKREMNLSL